MKNCSFIILLLASLSAINLSSCNGGGSSPAPPPSPTPAPTPSPTPSPSSYSTVAWFCPYSQQTLNNLGMTSISNEICSSTARTLTGNGLPSDQLVGTFPNTYCPNTISSQNVSFTATVTPTVGTVKAVAPTVGYMNNGVALDPGTAEIVRNDGKVWNIEAINPSSESPNRALNLGLDDDNGHVQPTGKYHYHGLPVGYLDLLSGTTGIPSKPILGGWAVDGFPIYLLYGYSDPNNTSSSVVAMVSSYQLKTTPDAGRPSTAQYPMGTFTQDYEYVAGIGNLDECNGATVKTQEFPNGIYAYFITNTYPYIQRCVKGNY